MRLLITRPIEAAEPLAAALAKLGHSAILAPMLEVRLRDGETLSLTDVQAILATSANGVRAFLHRSDRRDLPLYAVGPQTAEAAREAGFRSVVSAEGDGAALAEKAASDLDPAKGALFHAAGAETAGRLIETLKARGFTMESEILYDAVPVDALPASAEAALRENKLDGVLFFSPRTAKIFSQRVSAAKIIETCAPLTAFCISAATATALGDLEFARVAVAGNPNQSAIFALLSGGTQ